MDKSDLKPVSVIVGNCLACDGLVRIPNTTKSNSVVRCPHCQESFPLHQILDNSIPELEVIATIDNTPEPIIPHFDREGVKKPDEEQKPREKFVVPRQLTMGAKRKGRHRRRDSSSSTAYGNSNSNSRESSANGPSRGAQTGQDSAATANRGADSPNVLSFAGIQTDTDGPARKANSAAGRPAPQRNPNVRKKPAARFASRDSRYSQPQPLFEVLKVVLGGALAFPIAYLLLFWLFHQDPLALGHSLGKWVPFAVPADLRTPAANREPVTIDEPETKPRSISKPLTPTEPETENVDPPAEIIIDVNPDKSGDESKESSPDKTDLKPTVSDPEKTGVESKEVSPDRIDGEQKESDLD